jgi:hypothetical protein
MKGKFKSPKHPHQTDFETLKYQHQIMFEKVSLAENEKKLLKFAKNFTIQALGSFREY